MGAVTVQWMGAAGVYISDGDSAFLIDPYVTRAGIFKVVSGLVIKPNRSLIRDWADSFNYNPLGAVFVSHSHFDHVMDAPPFAEALNTKLVGSKSTASVGKGYGLKDNHIQVISEGMIIKVGRFSIQILESRHGPAFLGRVPYPGEIINPLPPCVSAKSYKVGKVFSFLIRHPLGTVLHHGSAGFKEGMYDNIAADTIILGIAGRGDTKEYLQSVPEKVKGRNVIPVHYDNFFRPLNKPMTHLPNANIKEFLNTAKDSFSFQVKLIPIGAEEILFSS